MFHFIHKIDHYIQIWTGLVPVCKCGHMYYRGHWIKRSYS